MRFIYLLPVLLLSCTARTGEAEEPRKAPSAATAPAPVAAAAARPASEAGTAFQQSYDDEAVGKTDAALAALDALPASHKDGYVAQLRRGWLLYKLGKYADSVAAYARATAQDPAAIEARVGATAPLVALRRWADVETTTKEILARDPGNYTAGLRLAFAVYSQGRYPEAEGLYRKLLALYPSDVDVRAGLGWSLLKMGRSPDAARAFAEVLDLSPRNALALDGIRIAKP
jgi:tetratricopeptide (TPR) repeat protein